MRIKMTPWGVLSYRTQHKGISAYEYSHNFKLAESTIRQVFADCPRSSTKTNCFWKDWLYKTNVKDKTASHMAREPGFTAMRENTEVGHPKAQRISTKVYDDTVETHEFIVNTDGAAYSRKEFDNDVEITENLRWWIPSNFLRDEVKPSWSCWSRWSMQVSMDVLWRGEELSKSQLRYTRTSLL